MMLAGTAHDAYTFWLIPFYFATLIPLVVASSRIKHAPPTAATGLRHNTRTRTP
jgi:hypothetical protein